MHFQKNILLYLAIIFFLFDYIACQHTKKPEHINVQQLILLNSIHFKQPKNSKKIGNIDSIRINILKMNLELDFSRPEDSFLYYYDKNDSAGFIIYLAPSKDSADYTHILHDCKKYDSLMKKSLINFNLLNIGVKEINKHKYVLNEYTNNADLHKYGHNSAIWNYTLSACYIPNKKQIIGFYFVSCSKKYPAFRAEAYNVLETLEIKDDSKPSKQ